MKYFLLLLQVLVLHSVVIWLSERCRQLQKESTAAQFKSPARGGGEGGGVRNVKFSPPSQPAGGEYLHCNIAANLQPWPSPAQLHNVIFHCSTTNIREGVFSLHPRSWLLVEFFFKLDHGFQLYIKHVSEYKIYDYIIRR